MIEFFVNKKQLELALKDLQTLEERGLDKSLASFKLIRTGDNCDDDLLGYNKRLIMKSSSGKCFGSVSASHITWYRYENGELSENEA